MPELPEVETVKETLKPILVGKEIKEILITYDNIIKEVEVDEFKKLLIGEKFTDIKRRGKFLIFELENYSMISHLRMEGKYFFKNKEDFNKHDHVKFDLGDKYLVYNDVRKFGTMHVVKRGLEFTDTPIKKLGYEPFDEDINIEFIKKRLNSRKPIKTALLDQTILTGLGNIYVDEVCFRLSAHPTTPSHNFINRVEEIIEQSKIVLDKAIKLGGTTIRSYTSSEGVTGRFQNELLVHQRGKEPCHTCNTIIEKIKVGGRGTFFCPKCQK